MTTPRPDDDRLAELLSDAVSDVEPREALHSIRTRTKVSPMPSNTARRPWLFAVGGAAVATAAVLVAVNILGNDAGLTAGDGPDPADSPSATADPTPTADPSASQSPSEPPAPPSSGQPSAIYYVGETPMGPRLYRYFEPSRGEADHGFATELALLTSAPSDPDYRTLWPAGAFAGASDDGEVVTVELADASLRERPADMSEAEATVAVEQVVYTLQGAVQRRAPVQFVVDGNPVDQVYGVPTSEPITNAPPLEVLALVNITAPAEGATVSDTFTASGVASSFEATVPWQVRRGDQVVLKGFSTAEGWMDKLYPWQTEVDVSGLEPGTYTFVAMTDDPSGGEGFGPTEDTRTIVVE